LRDIWNRITEIHTGPCSGHRNAKYVSLRKWTTIQSEFGIYWCYIIHSKSVLKWITKLSSSVTRKKIGNVLKTYGARSHNVYTSSDIVTARYRFHSKRALLWRLNGTPNNKTYLGLHANCPISLLDFNQIWNFTMDIHKNPEYEISRKSVQWKRCWCTWTEGQKDELTTWYNFSQRDRFYGDLLSPGNKT
jgi:hypothetical protein